jgi:leucyl-tRNA synthetase
VTRIACLDDPDPAPVRVATTRRNRVYAEFVARLTEGGVVEPTEQDIAAVLARLAEESLLSFQAADDSGAIAVQHVPSQAAAMTLMNGVEEFAPSVNKRITSVIRRTPGALFSFPAETGDGELEVFITDWSPCPAACAVAVHRWHPYIRRSRATPTSPSYFTGLYVRHPLTGDLLPVWVAEWVKPEFGTGAVLVNPAHDAVDLSFGRAVGLPIRFALMPPGCSEEPEGWPVPPVIRTGTATKTGGYDGMSVDDARAAYLEALLRRGLAKHHVDVRLPSSQIATLTRDDAGGWVWSMQDGTVGLASDRVADHAPADAADVVRVSLHADSLLRVAAAVAGGRAELVLMGATAQKAAAHALAPLLVDVVGANALPEVTVTGTAEYSGGREFDDVMRLAYLVVGDPKQPVAVRDQLLDQAESFLSSAAAIRGRLAQEGAAPPKSVLTALGRADPVTAFRDLHKWQKAVLKADGPVEEQSYEVAFSALVGKSSAP